MLNSITPVILTYNEAPNIGCTLEKLRWAKDIVIVDSFSFDTTLDIIRRFPQARIVQRRFDSHAAQWNAAINETDIRTEWVLAMDADYVLSDELVDELAALLPPDGTAGYRARFTYCVHGKPLRGAGYPPVTVLYRRDRAVYRQDGHTQRVEVDGEIQELRHSVLHDDRKSLSHWLVSQDRYMKLEVAKLSQAGWKDVGWADRLRKMRIVFPFIMFFYCLFVKGAVLDGSAGLYYSFQRMLAEMILSLRLIQYDLDGVAELEEK